jgi:pimeloyl-ACP methyl ester carboxylesterase
MKLLATFLAALACVFTASAASAQTAAGDWNGVMFVSPAQSFHLAIHIKKTDGGGYAGTLDDTSREVFGIALGDLTVTGDTLSFKVAIAGAPASYAAKWDAAAGDWAGQWTQQGQSFALTLAPGPAPPMPTFAGLDGAWDGVLTAPSGGLLHMTLHVRTGAGGTAAWMDVADQLSYGLDVQSLSRDGPTVSFEMTALHATYKGALAADGQSLAGQFTQGVALPLTLTRRQPGAAGPASANRPQTPVKPYPYREEDVTFDDAPANVKLAGTLTLPPGAGPFPAVVLVAGSGPNTRDEPLLGHQVFLVLADYLTRHGIAVLRYDKRGTGASGGDYGHATTMDFADDAEVAAAYLRGRQEVDPRHVGLIGHSEGGLIVPIVATRDPAVAFIVMMAGPGVDGADILTEQGKLIAKAMGMNDAAVADGVALRAQLFAIVRGEKDPAVATAKLKVALDAYAKSHNLPAAGLEAQAGVFNSDWFRFFYDYDPAPTLAKVRCPVLALIGSKDLQVPPDQNLPPIRAALAHNPGAEVEELPSLNHLFQTAKTGSPGEYGQIEETMAPLALETITAWILKQPAAPR